MLVHRTELNKSTQLQATFIGQVRQRHDYTSYWVAAAKLGRLVLGWCQIPLHGHGPDQTGTDPTRQSPRTSRRPRFPAKSGRARLQWNLDISFQHMFPAAVHTRVQISSVHMPWTSVNRNPIQKVAHTRLPSVGFRSWSRFLAVSLRVTWVINPAVGCHYFPSGPQLPSQPLRGLLPISLLGEQRHDGCEQFA